MSVLSGGRQLSHLLTNGSHLFAVGGIDGDQANLLSHCCSTAASLGGFLERGTHSLRVVQALGAYDVKRSGTRIIEPYVQRASHSASVARIVLQAGLKTSALI
jgi:hypothetical protein